LEAKGKGQGYQMFDDTALKTIKQIINLQKQGLLLEDIKKKLNPVLTIK
jgi:hypothetical protein